MRITNPQNGMHSIKELINLTMKNAPPQNIKSKMNENIKFNNTSISRTILISILLVNVQPHRFCERRCDFHDGFYITFVQGGTTERSDLQHEQPIRSLTDVQCPNRIWSESDISENLFGKIDDAIGNIPIDFWSIHAP